jgi:ribonuclease G
MQITRQRMKPEIDIKTDEDCPACHGSGKIGSTMLLEDDIYKNLEYLLTHGHKGLTLLVHPIFYAFLTKGFPSKRMKWSIAFKQWVKINPDNSLHLTGFKFIDRNEEEIKL